ncbi:C80 family cysteine peptidase [Enterobacter roggenkampii]|nr:C80 family cysteine peptidase [Enterobacter roggenkampii]
MRYIIENKKDKGEVVKSKDVMNLSSSMNKESLVPLHLRNRSINVKIELIGHGTTTSLGGLNAYNLSQIIKNIKAYIGDFARITQVNLVGCNTAGNSSDYDIVKILSKSYPFIKIKGYKGTIKVDEYGNKNTTTPDSLDALSLPADIILGSPEFERLLTAAKDIRNGNNRVKHLNNLSRFEKKIVKEASAKYVQSRSFFDGASKRNRKRITSLINALESNGLVVGDERSHRSESGLYRYHAQMEKEGISLSDLRRSVSAVSKKLASGPVLLGEDHSSEFARDIASYLLFNGHVKNMLIEAPDINLLKDEDFKHWMERPNLSKKDSKTLSLLREDIKNSGAVSLSDYLTNYDKKYKQNDKEKELKQSENISGYLRTLPIDIQKIIVACRREGISLGFVDHPLGFDFIGINRRFADGRIKRNAKGNTDYDKIIAHSLDLRNEFMASAIKEIISGSDGAGTLYLVGGMHLVDKNDVNLKSVQGYLEIPNALIFMGVKKYFSAYLDDTVTTKNLEVNNLKLPEQKHLRDTINRRYKNIQFYNTADTSSEPFTELPPVSARITNDALAQSSEEHEPNMNIQTYGLNMFRNTNESGMEVERSTNTVVDILTGVQKNASARRWSLGKR